MEQKNKIMTRIIQEYELRAGIYYETGIYSINFWLDAGERCSYFAHSDTYLFEARHGIVPFFDREHVEAHPNIFRPLAKVDVEKMGKRIITRLIIYVIGLLIFSTVIALWILSPDKSPPFWVLIFSFIIGILFGFHYLKGACEWQNNR